MTRTLRLGDTDVNRIGLGTNRLAHTPENVEFIQEAVAAGVNVIDTAHLYTAGDSERTIGAALSPPPAGCVIETKGGFRRGEGRPEVLAAQIEQSLRSLATDTIELYYLHRVDPETPLETSLGTTWQARSISSTPTSERPTCRIRPRSRYSLIVPRLVSSGVFGSTRCR